MQALVCGAGIAGLTLAARLRHHGWDVLVVDHAPGPRPQGYMMDFFGPGYEALTAMGLLPRLKELGYRTKEFRYIDERGGKRAGLAYSRFEKAARGGMVSIMRPDLERLLREAAEEYGAELRYGTTVDAVTDTGGVTLSDGTRHTPDLVVGADGIHSHIRELLFGPEQDHLRHLGMRTAAWVFADDTVFQRVKDRFVLTDTTHRQLGFYGLRDGRVAAFAVHRTDPALPEDRRDALRQVFAGMGPLADRALSQCPPSHEVYYDVVAQSVVPHWSHGNVTLIGDAAHAVSLIAGQGASLGVAGAYLLAERLKAADSVPAALAEYERRWRPVTTEVQTGARDRIADWFLPTTSTQLLVRRWAFRAMALPGLDSLFGAAFFPATRHSVTELSA
ncbi:FAD-dependent monooxygenase [Streptomyces sp. TRM49041]|uniref:FAD-dependent monooxygenase n=1 Tax=Streptomyces sp. TRM49041 TaxID=2603216 RepID=UPI0011EF7795|nr:FAD-dependent monooxygenase [Streptomyces sp. TRM49041]